ncbi:MAG: PAS domain S-box-containing protein [Planctomycetota bacterium]|jgi:PAS domain S-box-containing protein
MNSQSKLATEKERTPSADEILNLQESFQLFTRSTIELESSYKKLTRKATRIDIELKRTNEALSRKVKELGALSDNRMSILDALPNGIVVIDECRTINSVNPAAERILGRRTTELVGRSADAVVGPTGDFLLLPTSNPNSVKKSWERDVVALDGSRRQISFTSAILPDGCELQVLNDLTVVARLKEQVGRLDTMASLGEMAAGVAHEIRNPLNGIDGFAGLLARSLQATGDNASLIRYAQNIRRGVSEVNDIVTNLLTFASPETIQLNPVALSTLVHDVVTGFVDRANQTAKLVCEGFLSSTTTVAGDPVKLKIIFSNLIQNALQAVGDSGSVHVTIARGEDRKTALVTVNDDGGGIPDEIRERLFQPFCTTKASGTGLGLAIASKFAAMHNGAISCQDIHGGTSFKVTLPIATEVNEHNDE